MAIAYDLSSFGDNIDGLPGMTEVFRNIQERAGLDPRSVSREAFIKFGRLTIKEEVIAGRLDRSQIVEQLINLQLVAETFASAE